MVGDKSAYRPGQFLTNEDGVLFFREKSDDKNRH